MLFKYKGPLAALVSVCRKAFTKITSSKTLVLGMRPGTHEEQKPQTGLLYFGILFMCLQSMVPEKLFVRLLGSSRGSCAILWSQRVTVGECLQDMVCF